MRQIGRMKKSHHPLLFWSPRLLAIAFAVFLSLFALDVFDGERGFWDTALALLLHLLPTVFILLTLLLAWKWEWIGGTLFIAFGLCYIVWAWGVFPFLTYLVIAGPLFLVGILFWLDWKIGRARS